jgi:beta-N-acetylhexosaminidase
MFMQPGTIARAFHAGCDLFIVSRNINSSSLERTYKIAEDFSASLNNGSLDVGVVEAARERVEKLLQVTPQYPVSTLDKETLVKNAELSILISF